MNLQIITQDPLHVLSSTKYVVEHAKDVSINTDPIPEVARKVKEYLDTRTVAVEDALGSVGNLPDDLQLIFIQDCVNFCFWPDLGEPKWQVEWPKGHITTGGWYGLLAAFQRTLAHKTPILNPHFLVKLSLKQTQEIFRGIDDRDIPLLKERQKSLQQAGKILLNHFDGQFINVVTKAQYDAIQLTKLLVKYFPSFRDTATYQGKKIVLLKRAQICANDTGHILRNYGKDLTSENLLSAFADYKLPQILRMFGVFEYSKKLADKIDNYIFLPKGSKQEVEIRAATIWAVELIRQQIPQYTAGPIDNGLWFLSQTIQEVAKPYHRTRTIYY